MSQTIAINMSNPAEKAIVLRALNELHGPTEITIKKKLKLRSNAQNRLYFGAYVTSLQNHLRLQGEPVTREFCHKMLATKFLKESIINPVTGEFMGEFIRSTTELTTKEFSDYLDLCYEYLTTTFNIRIPTIHEFTGGDHGRASVVSARVVDRRLLPAGGSHDN